MQWIPTLHSKAVLEPYEYTASNPGKEIRGMMINAFNAWLNVPEAKLKIITKVVRMLHNASLLWVGTSEASFTNLKTPHRVDDIEDDSQLRRGQPGMFLYILYYFRDLQTNLCLVAHKIYGIPQTINTANYVYFLAYQELYALRESVTSTSSSSSEQLQCLYGIHTHSTLHSRFNSSHASNNIRYRTRQDSDLSVSSLSLIHLC